MNWTFERPFHLAVSAMAVIVVVFLYFAWRPNTRCARHWRNCPNSFCVISTRPDWINYYAQRRSEMPAMDTMPDADFRKALTASGCRYGFMSPFVDRTYPRSMYPIERIAASMSPVDYRYIADPISPGKRIEFVLAKYLP